MQQMHDHLWQIFLCLLLIGFNNIVFIRDQTSGKTIYMAPQNKENIEGSTKYHTNTTKAIWTLQNPVSEPLVG